MRCLHRPRWLRPLPVRRAGRLGPAMRRSAAMRTSWRRRWRSNRRSSPASRIRTRRSRRTSPRASRPYGAFLLGCGTASYAALTGTYLLLAHRGATHQLRARQRVQVSGAIYHARSLAIALSQSGETADIIEGMQAARARGAQLAALVNVPGSSLARMADFVVPLTAGPEQCVLSTKAYTAKIATLLLTAHALAGGSMRRRPPEASGGRDGGSAEWRRARTLVRAGRGGIVGQGSSLRHRARARLSDRARSGLEDQGSLVSCMPRVSRAAN